MKVGGFESKSSPVLLPPSVRHEADFLGGLGPDVPTTVTPKSTTVGRQLLTLSVFKRKV